LGGQPLGRDLGALEAETGPLRTNTSLTLHLKVPGKVSGNADAVDPTGGQWTFALGDQPRQLVLAGTTTSAAAWQWAAGAAAGVVVLLMLLGFGWRRRRRRRRLDRAGAPDGTVPAAERAAPAAESAAPRKLELVALDAHGAMFTQTDPVSQVLLPFVAARGGVTDPVRVRAAHRAAIEGRIDSAALWRELEVAGDAAELDAAVVELWQPTANLADFAALVARRGIHVACVANEVAAWAALLQQRYPYVQPWVVSADLGVLVPEAAVFEHLATRTGVPLRNMLYLDDTIEGLDAARALGIATALFGSVTPVNGSKHRHARGFSDLLRAGR
jgi:beta-phosphoglucomutase-like phosphatase (HAD superfamily)